MYPEYPTQDILLAEEVCSSSGETTESEVLELEQMRVGDIVEVYWEGEHEWYEGECTNVDLREHQFEMVYSSDGVRCWRRLSREIRNVVHDDVMKRSMML